MRQRQGFRFSDTPIRDQEVEGSNPFAPTTSFRILPLFFPRLNGQMDECFKIQVRRIS